MEVIGKTVWAIFCYAGGFAVAVLLHELGHAFVALLATRQRVRVQIGREGRTAELKLGRLDFVFRLFGTRYGMTQYDRAAESKRTQIWVALGGPLASLAAFVGFAWQTAAWELLSWGWLAWFALCLASFRILVVSVWPIEYRPGGPGGKVVWISDGLDIWRMWKRSDG